MDEIQLIEGDAVYELPPVLSFECGNNVIDGIFPRLNCFKLWYTIIVTLGFQHMHIHIILRPFHAFAI